MVSVVQKRSLLTDQRPRRAARVCEMVLGSLRRQGRMPRVSRPRGLAMRRRQRGDSRGVVHFWLRLWNILRAIPKAAIPV